VNRIGGASASAATGWTLTNHPQTGATNSACTSTEKSNAKRDESSSSIDIE
jgi:hypothetical protein